MDAETIVECLYELKSRGRHALEAIEVLREEILQSPKVAAAERQVLSAILNEVESSYEDADESLSLTLLLRRLLGYNDVGSRWALLMADKILNLR